jgi:phytoene dehydrogenase-like protein
VVGGGHNGLVCAGYLARAGLRTVVIERRETVGGALASWEPTPGTRVPAAAHTIGRLRASIVHDLGLRSRGLVPVRPSVRAFVPQSEGQGLALWTDVGRTAEGLERWSPADALAYPRFDRKVRALGSLLAHVNVTTPPDLDSPGFAEAMDGLRLGRAIRGLGSKANAREALRVIPMAVADLVGETFESPVLRGALAARGVQYTSMGPWSAGTGAVFLNDGAGNDGGAAGQTVFARGGPGGLTGALEGALRWLGGEVRCGAEVVSVTRNDGRVSGVALATGDEVPARVVVSGLDPRRTFGLVDPVALGPHLAWRAGNLRMAGSTAKVNLVLEGMPQFPSAPDEGVLHGRIVMAGDVDDLERAFDASKYGRISEAPYLEATIPSLADPSLVPDGRHVMSVLVQFAPYRLTNGDWDAEREPLGDRVLDRLETFAPGISGRVVHRQVLTPLDLEREYGLTGGHPLHGEPGLDQFFAWRPMWGYARYRMPVEGLYLCGSGAHPGGGVTGGPGANAAREILADLRRSRS